MVIRNYGWKQSKPDSRDFRLKTVNPVVYKSLPSSVDLRPIIPEVLDQGELGSCFSGDTVIPLMNGKERTLKELSEGIEGDFFYIYSLIFNDKFYEVVPALASAFKTRENQKTLRIFLDNGEWFDCTLDHKLLSREGEYIEAKDITVGQSLMPLNRKIDNSWLKGYELVENPGEKWHYTHKISSKFDKGLSTPKGSVIHHKDFNKLNNSPDNLIIMTNKEHSAYHAKLSGFGNYNGSEEQKLHSRKLMIENHKKENYTKKTASIGGKAAAKKYFEDEEYRERVNGFFKLGLSEENRIKAKNSLLNTLKKEESKEKKSFIAKTAFREGKLNNFIIKGKENIGKNSTLLQCLKNGKYLIENQMEFNEENWNKLKKLRMIGNLPKFKTALKYFNSIEEFKEKSLTYNHKVVKIIENERFQDVYCLNVPETENFAIKAGIFVHNCTAHALTMAHRIARIKQGLPDMELSRLFVYYNERLMEGTVD